ncbi:uncharacterized protein [Nicotiana tomentosiformis]|uniref:uncharacterized protein n=1 Tax=Nicotiana tomentosiformis TaxID=4098 RepID=UPI00388CE075
MNLRIDFHNTSRRPRGEAGEFAQASHVEGRDIVRPCQRQAILEDTEDDEEEDLESFNRGRGNQQRQAAQRFPRNEEFRLKVDLPTFAGNLNIEGFMDWITEVDRFFDYMEIPEEHRVKLVAYRLKGAAFSWWERLHDTRRRVGKGQVRTWYRMKKLLKVRFLPPDYEQYFFLQYQWCSQGDRSVHDYTTKFMRLAERNNLIEFDSQQVARYINRLKPTIQEKIGVQMLANVAEAQNMALKEELMMQEKKGDWSRKNRFSFAPTTLTRMHPPIIPRNKQKKFANDRVVGKRPVNEAHKQTQVNLYARPTTGKCYGCHQTGITLVIVHRGRNQHSIAGRTHRRW